MAITDTYTFNPDLGEIMEEAFERVGVEFNDANDIRTARRSLNYIALEWQNKGINLWTIEEATALSMVADTANYTVDINTISILDAIIRTDDGDANLQRDLTCTRMSWTTYSQITNKLSTGRPLQYWFQRTGIKGGTSGGSDQAAQITLWPVPDVSSTYSFVYWRMKRIADMGNDIGNTVQVPDRFIPALTSALAVAIRRKKPTAPSDMQELMMKEALDWKEASEEDRVKEDFFLIPDLSAYS